MTNPIENMPNKKARNLLQQGPGRLSGSANPTAAHSGASNKPLHSTYHVSPAVGEAFKVTVGGREGWTLRQLAKAGTKGVASVESPALRLTAYVCELRKKGVPIETLTEPHGGEFPGTHARYIMHATATEVRGEDGHATFGALVWFKRGRSFECSQCLYPQVLGWRLCLDGRVQGTEVAARSRNTRQSFTSYGKALPGEVCHRRPSKFGASCAPGSSASTMTGSSCR